MNPTKKFVSKLNFFLKLIPSRFINSNIALDFKTSTIEISIPNSQDLIKIHSEGGIITVEHKNQLKKYNCNFLNSARQIDDAVNYIVFLSPKDNITKPKLLAHQFALSFCEPDTGILLCTETMNRRIGWGDVYIPFDSKENAIGFAENFSKDKSVECTLYDNNYEYLQTIPGQKSTNR
jgi:hypothetical protein